MKKWILAAFAALLAWNVWLTVKVVGNNSRIRKDDTEQQIIQTEIMDYTTDLTDTIDRVRGSIVTVSSVYNGSDRSASGVVFDVREGTVYIFTTSSVCDTGAEVGVTFASSVTVQGKVIGTDLSTGLALITVNPGFTVTALRHGNSSLLEQGEYVIAMGGKRAVTGSDTVSFGVVSEPGQRRLSASDAWIAEVIEADITATAETYGGPLMDIGGELMGIIIPRPYIGQDKLGYAVTINEAEHVFAELTSEQAAVTKGSLGAVVRSVADMQSYEKSANNIPLDTVTGVYVTLVIAGEGELTIETGDVILSVNDEEVTDREKLLDILYAHEAGESVTLKILRDGEEMTGDTVLQ